MFQITVKDEKGNVLYNDVAFPQDRSALGKLPNAHSGGKLVVNGKRYQFGANITEIAEKGAAVAKPIDADAK